MAISSTNLKILIIGPCMSGKSMIANFLSERSADSAEVLNPNYRPTAGVRILEFEKDAPKNPKRPGQDKVLVELWDVSGDLKYDRCWPAIQKDAHGIILVYNVENAKHEMELENWVANFPKKCGIQAAMCIGFAHHVSGKPIKGKSKQPNGLTNLQIYDSSIEEGKNTIGPAFDKYFNQLMTSIYDRQEKEENKLLQD